MDEVSDSYDHQIPKSDYIHQFKNTFIVILTFLITGSQNAFVLVILGQSLYQHGAIKEQIDQLKYFELAYALRILIAYFIDTYFVTIFGRRKTYYLGSAVILGGILIAESLYIQEKLQLLAVSDIMLLGFILLFLTAAMEISMDTWISNYHPKQVMGYSSAAKYISQVIGHLLTVLTFKYTKLTPSTYMQVLGVCTILYIIYGTFRIHENNLQVNQCSPKQLKRTFKKIYRLTLDWQFQYLAFFLLSFQIGTALSENNIVLILAKQYPSSDELIITEMVILSIFCIIAAYILKTLHCFQFGSFLFLLRNLNNIILAVIFIYSQNIQTYFIIYQLIMTAIQGMIVVVYLTYIYQVADFAISASFITYCLIIIKIGINVNIWMCDQLIQFCGVGVSSMICFALQISLMYFFESQSRIVNEYLS